MTSHIYKKLLNLHIESTKIFQKFHKKILSTPSLLLVSMGGFKFPVIHTSTDTTSSIKCHSLKEFCFAINIFVSLQSKKKIKIIAPKKSSSKILLIKPGSSLEIFVTYWNVDLILFGAIIINQKKKIFFVCCVMKQKIFFICIRIFFWLKTKIKLEFFL